MYNIIIAEDHQLARSGIKMILELNPEFKVVAEADNGNDVLSILAAGLHADLVLSDITMPEMDGMTLLDQLQASYPEIKVIMLSAKNDLMEIPYFFARGACGYLDKVIDLEEFLFAVQFVCDGNRYLSSEISLKLFSSTTRSLRPSRNGIVLSDRELRILNLLSEGCSNTDMSGLLGLSKRTIEGIRSTLLVKTGAKNVALLIRYAIDQNLLD